MTIENEKDDYYAKLRYAVDMGWYKEQERSFMLLAKGRLCPAAHKKLPKSEAGLLNTFKQCCSKWDGFMTPNMALLEMIFRIFLASGNKSLSLEQIQAKLQQRLSDTSDSRDISIPKLKRIIDDDRFYGVKQINGNGEAEPQEPNTSPQID